MKVGFVVSFFDFRNDVRRLISQVTKSKEVILFVNSEHIDLVKKFEIKGTTIRVIEEKIPSLRNRIVQQVFYFFRYLPKSKQNFYLMERFKIANLKDSRIRKLAERKLEWIMKLPKTQRYDTYLSMLSYSGKTKIDDIDHFVFFTEIANDYFLARCIDEKKEIKVYAYSWDHAFKHSRFSNQVKYLTWSEGTKDDIHHLQQIERNRITVWGSSQFAYIHDALNSEERVERTYSFRYIYYACAIGIEPLVPQEIKIIRILHQLILEYAPNLEFVVRPYPVLENWKLYESLQNEGIYLDDGFRTKNLSLGKSSIQEKFEKIDNAELLMHLGTTMGLEASFFKAPSLLIDFGYDKKSKEPLHVKHFIHQGQNDKYLAKACPDQWIQTEIQCIEWLKLAEAGIAKKNSQNNKIANQFLITSFEKLAHKLIS